jgi:hypothetical protein
MRTCVLLLQISWQVYHIKNWNIEKWPRLIYNGKMLKGNTYSKIQVTMKLIFDTYHCCYTFHCCYTSLLLLLRDPVVTKWSVDPLVLLITGVHSNMIISNCSVVVLNHQSSRQKSATDGSKNPCRILRFSKFSSWDGFCLHGACNRGLVVRNNRRIAKKRCLMTSECLANYKEKYKFR